MIGRTIDADRLKEIVQMKCSKEDAKNFISLIDGQPTVSANPIITDLENASNSPIYHGINVVAYRKDWLIKHYKEEIQRLLEKEGGSDE